jgi:hypothetical protein
MPSGRQSDRSPNGRHDPSIPPRQHPSRERARLILSCVRQFKVSAFRHWSIDRHNTSVRSADRKSSLPILNRFFISVPPTLQRSHKSIPEKVKPFGWLAQCLLFHLKQLITAEEFGGASPFLQTFAILQCTCPVSKRFTLQWALLYISGVLKKGNLDYH